MIPNTRRRIPVFSPWCLLLLLGLICPQAWSSPSDWKRLENPTNGATYRAIQHTPLGWFAVGSKGLIRFSPDTRRWFWSEGDPAVPSGRDFRGIAHCQQRTYVVGDSGVVVRTTDGLRWEQVYVGVPAGLTGIASRESELVAVGDSGLFLSVDGKNWKRLPFGRSMEWRQVVATPIGYLAVSRTGAYAFSSNGSAWSENGIPSFLFDRMAVQGAELVALGRRRMDSALFSIGGSVTAVARSSDGGATWLTDSSWTVPMELGQLVGLHSDGKRWYGVNTVGAILTSPDAIFWSYDSLRTPNPALFVGEATLSFHDGIWMSVGKWGQGWSDSDKLGTSRDLRNWACVTSSVNDDHAALIWPWRGAWWVARSEGNYPGSPTTIQRTKDFVHWEESFLGYGFPLHQDTLGAEVVLTGAFLSCRVDTALVGTCGPSRPRQSAFATTLGGWARAEAFGTNVQPDFVVLTRRTGPSDSLVDTLRGTGAVYSLRRFGARWVVAGKGWTGWATDSGAWHVADLPSSGYQTGMASDGKVLVLLNDTAKIWRSTDGEQWQPIRTGFTGSFHQVVHNGKFFTVVGDGGMLGWSRDGAVWKYDTVAGNYSVGSPAVSSALWGDSLVVGAPGGDLYLRERDWEGILSGTRIRSHPRNHCPLRYADPLGRARSRSERHLGLLPVH